MRVAGSAAPPPKSEAGLGWLWTGERDTMYNVFRLTGDGLHCLALIVLFAKMNQTRSCAGGCAVFVPWRIALTACCKVLARAGWGPPVRSAHQLLVAAAHRAAVVVAARCRRFAQDRLPLRDGVLLPM